MSGLLASLGLGPSALGWLGGGLAALVALVLGFLGVKSSAKKQGVAEGKLEEKSVTDAAINKQNQVVAEANAATVAQGEEVNEIHDRLDADPAYRDRVRARFSRD